MSLLDKSPGRFIAAANIVLYGTVTLECLMLLSGSMLAMYGVLLFIVAVSAFLCRWMGHLMSDGTQSSEPTLTATAPAAAAPAPAPAATPVHGGRRRAVPGGLTRSGAAHA